MKNLKKLLCLSLCALMLLSVLVACGTDEPADDGTVSNEEENSDVVSSDTEKEYLTDSDGFVLDEIPEGTTYGGADIIVLGWEQNKMITIPDKGGEGEAQHLFSKVYNNRLLLEDRLDINLKVEYVKASGDKSDERDAFIVKMQAGDGGYDLVQTFSLYPCMLAQQGLLVDLNTLEYPHLDMPWWPDAIREQWTQYDKLYFVGSNSSATAIRSMFVTFSYTDKIVGAGLTDPVDLVLEGTWTIDKMIEYTKAFSGDNANDPEFFGLVVDDFSRMDAFYYGAGFNSTINDADGVAKLALSDASYRTNLSNYVDKMVEFFKRPEVDIAKNTQIAMANKKTALMVASMVNIETLEDLSYSPIPMAKMNEEDEYLTMQNNGWDMWCIPKTTSDAERSGIVIEAFASSEYRTVAPYYFETILKGRYAASAKGEQIFDIIRNNVTYDFGRIAQFTFSNNGITAEGVWRSCFWRSDAKLPENRVESLWAERGSNSESDLLLLLRNFKNNNRT